jgi:putative tricarboxylic transport membrane protein
MNCSRRGLIVGALALGAGIRTYPTSAATWEPTRPIEIVVPSAAGGGLDVAARVLQRTMHDLKVTDQAINVGNKAGGNGAIGIVYANQHKGDGHYITVQSPALLISPLEGVGAVGLKDVTPVATLVDEQIIFAVAADSPFKTGRDVAAKLKTDTSSIAFAMSGSVGGHSHIALALVTQAAGGDPRALKVVAFNGGGEAVTALMGGHVMVTVTPASSILGPLAAGKVRVIGYTSDKRLTGVLADAPTWKEQGVDAVFSSWRALAGPLRMTPPQLAWWDGVLAKVTQAPEWEKFVEQNEWTSDYRDSATATRFFAEESQRYATVLKELDLLRA